MAKNIARNFLKEAAEFDDEALNIFLEGKEIDEANS